jgi:transcriptional regulator with XRE-family HTH domain
LPTCGLESTESGVADAYTAGGKPLSDGDAQRPGREAQAAAAAWAIDWGRLLRIARQVAGLSLTELSVRTGLSKGYLSKLESGATGAANPSRATLAALARALPSFRPLAHTLEPGLGAERLAFAGTAPPQAPVDPVPSTDPIKLGWRDLEVLAALVALDAAALAVPITAAVLARAVGRDVAAVTGILDGLVARGVVAVTAPARPGGPPIYACAPGAPAVIGVSRLGELLVLAAALIAGAPQGQHGGAPVVPQRSPRRLM